MTNEEQCRSWLRSQFGSASALFFSSFFFFSLISLNFSQCWTLEPFTQPPLRLFIAKDGIRGHGSLPRQSVASSWSNFARPGELVTSPLSYFGGPGELEASLGELGFKKKD